MAEFSCSTLTVEPAVEAVEVMEVGVTRPRPPLPTPRRSLVKLVPAALEVPESEANASLPTPSHQAELVNVSVDGESGVTPTLTPPKPKPRTKRPSVYEKTSLTPEGFVNIYSSSTAEKELLRAIPGHAALVTAAAAATPRKILKPSIKFATRPLIPDAYGYNTGGFCVNKNLGVVAHPGKGSGSGTTTRGLSILKCALL